MFTDSPTYRKQVWYLFLALFLACSPPADRDDITAYWQEAGYAPELQDLNDIIQRGKLVVLTMSSSHSYFLYRGEAMGFEYELLSAYASSIGVELEIRIARDVNTIFEELLSGSVDLLACNLTVTRERSETLAFTDPYLYSKQVLVQRKPTNRHDEELLKSPLELAGRNVFVHQNSSYYKRLQSLSDEIGASLNIMEAPGDVDPERLIRMVSEGTIDFTVADEHIAQLNQGYYPNIDVSMAISFPQKIAWACRKQSRLLVRSLNNWLNMMRTSPHMAILKHKYYHSPKTQTARYQSEFASMSGGRISPYDDLIQKFSYLVGWDWRLIAAQIAQESQFNPRARSWAGAFGLMQLMPQTAAQFGVDSSSSIEAHIKAGIQYLMWLNTYWENEIPDDEERIKFVLASYNVGLGHVIDARNLTEQHGGDSSIWHNHVNYFLRNKSKDPFRDSEWVRYGYCRCEEPVEYVDKILKRYRHYQELIS
ncbi:MAG: lytic transglycosylase F [Cryomorphaceae bacterium]|nr:MAG: lytic transglycosylase F [Cryomorphaceae bacterium]